MAKSRDKQQKKKERERRVAKKKLAAAEQRRDQEKTAEESKKKVPGRTKRMASATPKPDYVPTSKKSPFTQRRSGG